VDKDTVGKIVLKEIRCTSWTSREKDNKKKGYSKRHGSWKRIKAQPV
jgi:hypothetical protein